MLATEEEVDSIEKGWLDDSGPPCFSVVEECPNQPAVMVVWSKCCDRTRKHYYCMKHYKQFLRPDGTKRGSCAFCRAVCEVVYVCPVK